MTIKVFIKTICADSHSALRASASVTLDDSFVIRGVRLIEKDGRMFISMPSVRIDSKVWRNTCHPITAEFRERLEDAYIEAYNDYLANIGLPDSDAA